MHEMNAESEIYEKDRYEIYEKDNHNIYIETSTGVW